MLVKGTLPSLSELYQAPGEVVDDSSEPFELKRSKLAPALLDESTRKFPAGEATTPPLAKLPELGLIGNGLAMVPACASTAGHAAAHAASAPAINR